MRSTASWLVSALEGHAFWSIAALRIGQRPAQQTYAWPPRRGGADGNARLQNFADEDQAGNGELGLYHKAIPDVISSALPLTWPYQAEMKILVQQVAGLDIKALSFGSAKPSTRVVPSCATFVPRAVQIGSHPAVGGYSLELAMRLFGIIRGFPGTREVDRQGGTGPTA